MEFVTPPYGFTAWRGAGSLQSVRKLLWQYVTRKDTVFVLKLLSGQTSALVCNRLKLKNFLIQSFSLTIWGTGFSESSEKLIILHGIKTWKIIVSLRAFVLTTICSSSPKHFPFFSYTSLSFLRPIVSLLNILPHIISSK